MGLDFDSCCSLYRRKAGSKGGNSRDKWRGDEGAAFMCAKKAGRRGGTGGGREEKGVAIRGGGGEGEGRSTVKCALVVGIASFTLVSLIF